MNAMLGVFLVFALCLQDELLQNVVIAGNDAELRCQYESLQELMKLLT